jgi:magnesium transporter
MGVVVIVGSVIGIVLPFCATWLRLDPAVLSAPLLTSIMDILGVVIFLGLAALILV